jgi:hypothetical protein
VVRNKYITKKEGYRNMPRGFKDRPRGFNAAKKGSGQVGFQTAPPVHPDVPTPIDWEQDFFGIQTEQEQPVLDAVYNKYSTLVKIDPDESLKGLSEQEKKVVLAARQKLASHEETYDSFSPEFKFASVSLMRAWGFEEKESRELLTSFDYSTIQKQSNYYEYVSSVDATYEIRNMIGSPAYSAYTQEKEITELIEQVQSNKIMLTRHELDSLIHLRDHAYEVFLEKKSVEERNRMELDWVSATVDRHCELCGKFISTRDSHGSFNSSSERPLDGSKPARSPNENYGCQQHIGHHELADMQIRILNKPEILKRRSYNTEVFPTAITNITSSEDFVEPISEDLLQLPKTKPREDIIDLGSAGGDKKNDENTKYSLEYLEDIYASYPHMRSNIVAIFIEKNSLLGRNKKIVLPKNIREAFIEAPDVSSSSYGVGINPVVANLAAKIEPPLNDQEIKRLIDRGDLNVLNTLLKTKRTREMAVNIISDYPSQALRALSLSEKGLDPEILENMSTSGNPRIRAYAAGSPDLNEETIYRLAEDPDPMVRRALVIPHVDNIVAGETLSPYRGYYSALHRYPELGDILINDPDPKIAFIVFENQRYHSGEYRATTNVKYFGEWGSSYTSTENFSTRQKYLISKITSRERFNELKKHIINPGKYPYETEDPDVARFLAH